MGISETIIAAMIGAVATVTTALFQLFTAWRNRGRVDARPKRGMTTRSILAVLALMVASAAGGFLYSEFMKQRAAEDLQALRQELKDLKELTVRAARERTAAPIETPPPSPINASLAPAALEGAAQTVESVAYVPACRSVAAGACTEADAQRIALCGTIPSFARVEHIDLFVQPDAVQNAWDEHRAQIEQDMGGARFTGKSFEYAQGPDHKAVCVSFTQWSSDHPHIARILLRYGFGDAPADITRPADSEPPPASIPSSPIIAAEMLSPVRQGRP